MWQELSKWTLPSWSASRSSRGTRLAVEFLLGLMADGWPAEQILGNNPQLTADDPPAALHSAAESLKRERVYPLTL